MEQNIRTALLVATGTATDAQLASLGTEGVAKAKTASPQLRVKMEDPMPVEGEKPVIRFVASDETPDRMGDVIKVDGWQLANFAKNPVILWGHKGHDLPIGRGHAFVGTKANGEAALMVDIEFAVGESEKAAEVYALAKGGFLNAVSVGFLAHRIADVSDEERATLGLGRWGVLIEESELLEVSVVSVPANPNALAAGVKCLKDAGLEDAAEEFSKATPETERELFATIERITKSLEVEEPTEHSQASGVLDSFERVAKSQADTAEALADMAKSQAEHTAATRQLVDAIADLTSKLQPAVGERDGSVPEVVPPVTVEPSLSPETAKALEAIAKSIKAITD